MRRFQLVATALRSATGHIYVHTARVRDAGTDYGPGRRKGNNGDGAEKMGVLGL
jgi:hypothetical protein